MCKNDSSAPCNFFVVYFTQYEIRCIIVIKIMVEIEIGDLRSVSCLFGSQPRFILYTSIIDNKIK